jgi:putative FmdB family regulatory protein
MPIYEYVCHGCHGKFEFIQSFSEKPLKKCEECGGKLEKIISESAFHLKGSGWYKTDYQSPKKDKKDKSDKKEQKKEVKKD